MKSIGGCKCSQGFRPKNNAPNVDSDEDCEADVKPVCAPGETITVDGFCLTSAEEEFEYCNSYCAGGGSVIAGTGVCQCFDINDTDEVCDVSCQETKVQTKITRSGMLKVTDPVSGDEGEVDPST